jgi:signal transduction histidine kinase
MPAIASDRKVPARSTIRLRLTLLYGGLFVLCAAALLGIVYGLSVSGGSGGMMVTSKGIVSGSGPLTPPIVIDPGTRILMETQAQVIRSQQLTRLLVESGYAMLIALLVAGVSGWWLAGRALRPVRTMIAKAQRLSERNLHERLAVPGPNDELKDLGDTFDGLLGRLEAAFEAQTRFVANASHELRTPLTVQRAMIEVALADPDADAESLRAVCQRVLAVGEDQARLIEALLTLARSQRGLDRWEFVDVAAVAGRVLARQADHEPVRVDTVLGPANTLGDGRLVERLITNLVDNAVRHNVPDGWVAVWTGVHLGQPMLRVVNTGPVIPPEAIATLFQPFQRVVTRTSHDGGLGLGLSIVGAIAAAHGAALEVVPRPEGGLAVTVTFATADARMMCPAA